MAHLRWASRSIRHITTCPYIKFGSRLGNNTFKILQPQLGQQLIESAKTGNVETVRRLLKIKGVEITS